MLCNQHLSLPSPRVPCCPLAVSPPLVCLKQENKMIKFVPKKDGSGSKVVVHSLEEKEIGHKGY